MSWTQVTRQNNLMDRFYEILTVPEAYRTQNREALWRIPEERNGELWLYDDGQLQIPYSFAETIDHKMKILSGLPQGDYLPEEAMNIFWTKVRETSDRKNLREIYVNCLKDYGDQKLNEYVMTLEEIPWEHKNTNPFRRVDFKRFEYTRSENRVIEDHLMQGTHYARLLQRIASRRGR